MAAGPSLALAVGAAIANFATARAEAKFSFRLSAFVAAVRHCFTAFFDGCVRGLSFFLRFSSACVRAGLLFVFFFYSYECV